MRFIKNYHTGKHVWAKPVKLPRTVCGQLAFARDLRTKIMVDITDEDLDLYNPDYGWGHDATGITSNQVTQWLTAPGTCLECAKEMYAEEVAA